MSPANDTPPAETAAPTAPRPARRRWHALSKLLALACLAVLAAANVSGYVCWEWERQETGKPYAWHHGWPWTFLKRDGAPDPRFGLPTFDRDLWALNRRVIETDAFALAGNVAVGLGLTVLIAGACEWRRRRRHRLLQLTIGDLAGLTFLVAVVLGYGTWRYRTWERQAEVIAAWHSEYPRTQIIDEFYSVTASDGLPAWIRGTQGNALRPFDRVMELYVCDEFFDERITAFHPVESLVLMLASRHGDPTPLRSFGRLRHLHLDGPGITDVVLEQFSGCRTLRTLVIERAPRVTAAGIAHLANMTSLESLSVHLAPSDRPYTSEDFASLGRLRRLQLLELTEHGVPDEAMEYIASLPSLVALKLEDTNVSDAGVARLRRLTALRILELQSTEISDASLATIGQFENLTELRLDRTEVGDDGVAHLAGLTKLVDLSLYGTRVSDAGLAHLEGLPALEHVDLRATDVTAEGVARLRAKLPEAGVVYTPRAMP